VSSPRVGWIDSCKGVGIVLVVLAHVLPDSPFTTAIYWFHMPLFFFLSGTLYNGEPLSRAFVKRRAIHLLIPYAAFVTLLSIPYIALAVLEVALRATPSAWGDLVSELLASLLGGRSLSGDRGTVWFITCLLLCQLASGAVAPLFRRAGIAIVLASAYLLAYLDQRIGSIQGLPWAIDVVPMAVFYSLIGHLAGKQSPLYRPLAVALATAVFAVGVWGDVSLHHTVEVNMKRSYFGLPLAGPILAGAGILLTVGLSQAIDRSRMLAGPVRFLGQASLVIMFLHRAVHIALLRAETPVWVIVVASLLVPLAIYPLLKRTFWTRRVFLGEAWNATTMTAVATGTPGPVGLLGEGRVPEESHISEGHAVEDSPPDEAGGVELGCCGEGCQGEVGYLGKGCPGEVGPLGEGRLPEEGPLGEDRLGEEGVLMKGGTAEVS
jgi:fucose 4-O-acetylase-like acetyltransferase